MDGGVLSPKAEAQISAGLRKLNLMQSGLPGRDSGEANPRERGWCRLLKKLNAPESINDPQTAIAVIQVKNLADDFVDGERPENEILITHRMAGIEIPKNYIGRYERSGDEWLIYAGGCPGATGSASGSEESF